MFDLRPENLSPYLIERPAVDRHAVMLHNAIGLFRASRLAGISERIKARLFRRACELYNLNAISPCQVRGRHYGGLRCVCIAQICGSVGRAGDFSRRFHPLDDRLKDRWISVAIARGQGIPLPPVSLVQVGACYFVEDGHHRISVARALGETEIDAEITVWDVSGPLPWESLQALATVPAATQSRPLPSGANIG